VPPVTHALQVETPFRSLPDPQEKSPRYRPDIDGLRAIAVTSVVLFHAGLYPFSRGFVGVGIFFVTSGYLIGGIILRGVEADRFRFADFYARRARRILPALFLVIGALCAAGWFILSSSEYHGVGATSMSALLGVSNFSFWGHQDYFEPDARLAPLLMTWSLGVEEQFYVVFPLLIFAIMRWFPGKTVEVLGLTIVLSFAFSVFSTTAHPVTAFYLLPSRAWELGAGATLAASEIRWAAVSWSRGNAVPWLKQLVGLAGLGALAIAVFSLDSSEPFPGYRAILPVAGTTALIWSGGSIVNRLLLSAKPAVFVGMISYSWYLWHWPLMSYVRIVSVAEAPIWLMTLVGCVAFGFAVLSWRFVEQPFRQMKAKSAKTLSSYAIALAVALAITASIKTGEGFPLRLSPEARRVEATIKAGRGDCLALAPGLREVAQKNDWGVLVFTKSSCGPFLGVRLPHERMPFFAAACAAFMDDSFKTIADKVDIEIVMTAADWASYRDLGPEQFRAALQRPVVRMLAAGKHVVLVDDVPSWLLDPTHIAFGTAIPVRGYLARMIWLDQAHRFPDSGISSMTATDDKTIEAILGQIAGAKGVGRHNLRDRFCQSGGCVFEQDGVLLFLDNQHLSMLGSRFALARYRFGM
jgi:peptidoglycan/LPS O-acetylase OafA/YrhL